ncbi:MAG: ATP-binding protein [Actinomycetota bacterium]|nr:ATP-binding protein [Actinomycetota bacterium]
MAATAARDWQLDERGDGDVTIDAQRITQALLQLVSNAVRHTQTGNVIAVGSSRTADEVR